MEFTIDFLQVFAYVLYRAFPLLLTLLCIIILLGQIVGKKENWTWFDSLYWSFITSTTVGYGDIKPIGKISKTLAVFIAFSGLVFTGIVVALAFYSVTEVIQSRHDIQELRNTIDTIAK
ncbi:MAG: potassium channel family protein [Candidatus Hodarchaeota archaeon]